MRTVFLFSGLGSQYYQMGLDLYENEAFFRERLDELNAMCKTACGWSIVDAMYDPAKRKVDRLVDTALSGVAIFAMERALADTLVHHGVKPDLVVGSSMGMFAAGSVAGCLAAEGGLLAVLAQGQIFERHCRQGCMVAVLAPSSLYADSPLLRDHAEVAAVNFDKHFVISLPGEHLEIVTTFLRSRRLNFQQMPTARAFHSKWIEGGRQAFFEHFSSLDYRAARVPIVCCSKAGAARSTSAGDLWSAVREPIRFQDTVRRLEAEAPCRYIDVGPSGTLATFLKYALPPESASTFFPVLTPFGQDARNLQKVIRDEAALASASSASSRCTSATTP